METTVKPMTIVQQVERLTKIHESIERCRSMIRRHYDICESAYGRNEEGNVKCYDNDLKFIYKYAAIAKRLKQSYNNQLKSMNTYNISK